MSLDMNAPYEAHAVFALEFQCERCEGILPHFNEFILGSDEYYLSMATVAREKGWFCPEKDRDNRMQVMFCLCPNCVKFAEDELKKTNLKAI